jgi:hypothetical protein
MSIMLHKVKDIAKPSPSASLSDLSSREGFGGCVNLVLGLSVSGTRFEDYRGIGHSEVAYYSVPDHVLPSVFHPNWNSCPRN